jgi:hypothetical protein
LLIPSLIPDPGVKKAPDLQDCTAANIFFLVQGQSGGKLSPLEGGGGRAAGEERPAVPRGGLSCLASHTLDEDREPLFKSPEKKLPTMLSPSGRSISDIFGKVRLFRWHGFRALQVVHIIPHIFLSRKEKNVGLCTTKCSESVIFWCGSGSADPYPSFRQQPSRRLKEIFFLLVFLLISFKSYI